MRVRVRVGAQAAAAACALGLASVAEADTAIISVYPTRAQPGDLVTVAAGTWRRSTRMPLYLVRRDQLPRSRRLDSPPQGRPYSFVALLDFRERTKVRIRFRVPRLAPGIYVPVIYCDPCARGERGTLITSSLSLRVRRPD